jgi:hypothetical protein
LWINFPQGHNFFIDLEDIPFYPQKMGLKKRVPLIQSPAHKLKELYSQTYPHTFKKELDKKNPESIELSGSLV